MARRPPRPVARPSSWSAFAAIAPGLEPVLVHELSTLGISATAVPGGTEFPADAATLCRLHRWSRVAGRVTVKVGATTAASLDGLYNGVRSMPWREFVHPNQPIEVRATVTNSRLHHKDTLARKIENAIRDSLRGPRLAGPRPPREPFPVFIRLDGSKATLLADASGDLLHRRGWRLATAKAPLRENLAAAVLHAAMWSPDEALVDPMCGSGTFPIEAAGRCMGHAPGDGGYAFLRWPCVDARVWDMKGEPPEAPGTAAVVAADRDAGAITATTDNARRAGVGSRVRVVHAPFAELEPPDESGLVVMNPPWGGRIGAQDAPTLYRHVGDVLRRRWKGWRFAVLIADTGLGKSFGLPLVERLSFSSGGTRVHLLVSDDGSA